MLFVLVVDLIVVDEEEEELGTPGGAPPGPPPAPPRRAEVRSTEGFRPMVIDATRPSARREPILETVESAL